MTTQTTLEEGMIVDIYYEGKLIDRAVISRVSPSSVPEFMNEIVVKTDKERIEFAQHFGKSDHIRIFKDPLGDGRCFNPKELGYSLIPHSGDQTA